MNVLEHITSPALLLDEQICKDNISRMAEKAANYGVKFRPHAKTHQSAEIADWFRDYGVDTLTVSSIDMAEYFADAGWEEITIALPVNIRESESIENLAKRVTLSLLITETETIDYLQERINSAVQIYIEIDSGGHRTGLDPLQLDKISEMTDMLDSSSQLSFRGFYSHPGHSYQARSKSGILSIHREVQETMIGLKEKFPGALTCVGDTPCCSVAESFTGIDEISPGNFVFYDLMQVEIGSCSVSDIAVALAAPVVAKHPGRNQVTVHGGAIHLSKEVIETHGTKICGLPVTLTDTGWSEPVDNSYVMALSQEHGMLKCTSELFNKLEIGDLIGIIPVHSCLTANLMAGYRTFGNRTISHFNS